MKRLLFLFVIGFVGLGVIGGIFMDSPPPVNNPAPNIDNQQDAEDEIVEVDNGDVEDELKASDVVADAGIVEAPKEEPKVIPEVHDTPENESDEQVALHSQADVLRIEQFHKRIMDLYRTIEKKKTLGFNDPKIQGGLARQKLWLEFMNPWNAKVNALTDEIGTVNGNDPIPENTLRFAAGQLVTLSHPVSFNKPQTYRERQEYFLELIREFNSELKEFKIVVGRNTRLNDTLASSKEDSGVKQLRVWKDITGEFEIKAVFKGFVNDDEIELVAEDGKVIKVPLISLGEYEQEVAHAMQKTINKKSQ